MDELTNFCLKPFIRSASANLINQDGYGIENLFSLDPAENKRGFQMERFMRPPVSVNINFIIPICITHIVICLGLKDNDKCKLEVLVPKYDTTLFDKTSPSQIFCGSFVLTATQSPIMLNYSGSHKERQQLAFHFPNKVVGSQIYDKLLSQQITSQPLNSINKLTTASGITLSFTQYISPRAFAIKFLEVWGIPSKNCTRQDMMCFQRTKHVLLDLLAKQSLSSAISSTSFYNASSCFDETIKSNCVDINSMNVTYTQRSKGTNDVDIVNTVEPSPRSSVSSTKSLILSEFLDELTYDVMIIPMLLPSGHYVDQSTIDKCKETDLLYARLPSDPFTGVQFTESYKPQFCAHLKAEIDKLDSSSLSVAGRTVGTAEDIVKHRDLISML